MTPVSIPSAHPDSTVQRASSHGERKFDDFMIGQIVSIKVQRRLDEQQYLVVLRGEARKVAAEKPMSVGETVDAVVVRTGEKLELRQVSKPIVATDDATLSRFADQSSGGIDQSDVKQMAVFYGRNLTEAERVVLQDAVDASQAPQNVMLAGLFLSKKNVVIQPGLLNLLCTLQTNSRSDTDSAQVTSLQLQDVGALSTIGELAAAIRHIAADDRNTMSDMFKKDVGVALTEAGAGNLINTGTDAIPLSLLANNSRNSDGSTDQDDTRRFIEQLMNDMDSQEMGVRYGTLPVLIDGRLIELEVMLLQRRQQTSDVEPIRRLVMSIQTSTLGTVQVTAEALSNRLLIQISSNAADKTEALASYAQEVRELAERFGWAVESVNYEIRASDGRLAQRVMEYVVRQGVIDHVW